MWERVCVRERQREYVREEAESYVYESEWEWVRTNDWERYQAGSDLRPVTDSEKGQQYREATTTNK